MKQKSKKQSRQKSIHLGVIAIVIAVVAILTLGATYGKYLKAVIPIDDGSSPGACVTNPFPAHTGDPTPPQTCADYTQQQCDYISGVFYPATTCVDLGFPAVLLPSGELEPVDPDSPTDIETDTSTFPPIVPIPPAAPLPVDSPILASVSPIPSPATAPS